MHHGDEPHERVRGPLRSGRGPAAWHQSADAAQAHEKGGRRVGGSKRTRSLYRQTQDRRGVVCRTTAHPSRIIRRSSLAALDRGQCQRWQCDVSVYPDGRDPCFSAATTVTASTAHFSAGQLSFIAYLLCGVSAVCILLDRSGCCMYQRAQWLRGVFCLLALRLRSFVCVFQTFTGKCRLPTVGEPRAEPQAWREARASAVLERW